MTQTAVIVVGAGATGSRVADSLLQGDIDDFIVLEQVDGGRTWPTRLDGHLLLGRKVISSVFDDGAETWTLKTREGESYRGRVVIAAYGPMHVPWIPDLAGRNDFRGTSFHSAAWDPGFDSTGKRIAVVGGDATTGQFIDRLVASAASVKVFGLPPRRIVPVLPARRTRARRWLRGHVLGTQPRPTPELVRSPIDTVTTSGIRTCDGVDNDVDAIIYATGFSIPGSLPDQTLVGTRGLTIRQAWRDGMEPYAGLAMHGFPNYFLISGPDHEAQARYAVECVRLMNRTGSTRIEVRRSSQHVFNERVHLRRPPHHPPAHAFDLSPGAGVEVETYDGPATLTIADACRQVRVRLAGHLDPIDGQYHWQGIIFNQLSTDILKPSREVTLAVGERSAVGRITEQTPWGTCSIVGVGAPPFALSDVELATSQL